MSDYRNSEYAMSRNKAGIVYRFAESIVEIGVQEFIQSCPGLTEQDFFYWKQVSDQMYLEEKRTNWRNSHRNVRLCCNVNNESLVTPSAEDIYCQSVENQESASMQRAQMELAKQAVCILNYKQRRRFLLYTVYQLTTREIATTEGVSHVAVYLSIQSAQKRIKKFLENLEKEPKTP